MKKYSGFERWGPAVGVLAVGMLAFSLSLEGAAPSPQPSSVKEKSAVHAPPLTESDDALRVVAPVKADAPTRSGHATSAVNPDVQLSEGIKFGRMPKGGLPIMAPMTVDYREDSGTRLRKAGLLVGPYRPNLGTVAGGAGCPPTPGGACSFDIDCDDANPCTLDFCDINVGDPLGAGLCVNTGLANGAEGGCSDGLCCNSLETCQGGVCEAPGAGTGVFQPGTCEFPCSGGRVCNEDTNLCRLPCTGVGTCAITLGPCTSTPDCPPQTGNYCLNCNDGVNCNGVETCVAGVCETGTNPCGPGAVCGEKDCSGPGTAICTTDSDCDQNTGSSCNRPGPICLTGRCCDNATADPACTRRKKSGGLCTGGSAQGSQCETNAQCDVCAGGVNINRPCLVNGDCPGSTCNLAGSCNVTASCDAVGGKWYATDNGDIGIWSLQGTPTLCPAVPQENPPNDRTLCPKYTSGVAPPVDFDTETAFVIGAFSHGPCDHLEIGDDYQFESPSPVGMEIFRWVGGGGGRLLVEFYDEFGNFIEDAVTGGVGGGIAIRSLNFLPPITVPSKGYVVISVAGNFAPNGQTFVAVTDAVDEGVNLASGAGSLWLDGGPSSITLRECVLGTNDGVWCDPDDLGDSECVGGGGSCQPRDNILAFEIEGLPVAAPTGACCNDLTDVCTAGVIPWVCTAQGNNYQGNDTTCPGTCGSGACCNAGVCTETTRTLCVGGGGTFQGGGTTCDVNNEPADGIQTCCPQPTVTGADNCAGVVVQNFNVVYNAPPEVRTLTGNNSGASGPDTCLQGSWNAVGGTYLTVDPGWWEAFTINDCAYVRVDFCCSEPVIEPAWALLWKDCPCDVPSFTAVHPNKPTEPANKRGTPYCTDDNLWNKFGPLAAGTYYIPVYSMPPGEHGQYQMHITVESCPRAACCVGGVCQLHPTRLDELNQLECAAAEGQFLAPPNRTTAVDTCSEGICATGSCCYIPGQPLCVDIINSGLATETGTFGCEPLGTYKGGSRCKGCVCNSGSPPLSCNNDADCPVSGSAPFCINPGLGGGACSGQNLEQTSPCPVCEFDSTANCQRPRVSDSVALLNFRLSDDCIADCVTIADTLSPYTLPTIRVADDFTATVGGTLTSVCVWGTFQGQVAGQPDCSASGPPEKFRVKIYNDNGGLPNPNSVVVETGTTVTRKGLAYSTTAPDHIFQWQLLLNTPANIVQGNTYWLEVANNTDESSGDPLCDWFWVASDANGRPESGNGLLLQDTGNAYTFGDAEFQEDMGFCVTIPNTVPPILDAACCTCGGGIGTCSVQTLEHCTQQDGSWDSTHTDCTGVICRTEADAADTCVTDKVAVATNSNTAWNNYCTNTDGPPTAGTTGCDPGEGLQNDLWFTWTATCTGQIPIELCDMGGEIDTVLVIYTDHNSTCPCPTTSANQLDCDDDGCLFGGAGSRLNLSAVSGECYTFRVGGFGGVKGTGVLHVGNCAGGDPPVTPIGEGPHPTFPVKSRFITFSVTGGTGETALRVNLTSLHHVVPAYTGAPSIPFTLFEGQSVWVGPPVSYIESNANPIAFKSSNTQCAPHYRDWNTVGLLHVTGPGIVPSSIYNVENVAAACQGAESSTACQSGGANVSAPLEIKTARWGDVETPWNPPSVTAQPDVGDISALVKKFQSGAGAVIKARGLIAGADAFGDIDIFPDLGFGHISACVDAFRGGKYPYQMGMCTNSFSPCTANGDCSPGTCRLFSMGKCTGAPTPPSTGNCTSSAQCTGTNGAGPCIPFFGCP